jgi:hypothetical protein
VFSDLWVQSIHSPGNKVFWFFKKSVLGSQIMFSESRDPRVLGYEAQVSLALEFKMFRGWNNVFLT